MSLRVSSSAAAISTACAVSATVRRLEQGDLPIEYLGLDLVQLRDEIDRLVLLLGARLVAADRVQVAKIGKQLGLRDDRDGCPIEVDGAWRVASGKGDATTTGQGKVVVREDAERCLEFVLSTIEIALAEAVLPSGVVVERLLLRRAIEIGSGRGRIVENLDRLVGLSVQERKARPSALDAWAIHFLTEGCKCGSSGVKVADLQARVANDGHGADCADVALENPLSLVDRI